MNGVHDTGGMQGYGPVQPEPHEPLFHAPWERRALALTLAMGATGEWNIDMSRAARESLPPVQYLGAGYYGIWLAALEVLMTERGLVDADELAAGHALRTARPVKRVLHAGDVDAVLARGAPTARPATAPQRFVVGQRVRALNRHPAGHTRLPRYVRGHVGTVAQTHGAHVYADSHARGAGEAPQWLYTVVFDASTLWGPQAEAGVRVSVDAWDAYLEPAEPIHAAGPAGPADPAEPGRLVEPTLPPPP
jgi:nitrile hydratase beta subunit